MIANLIPFLGITLGLILLFSGVVPLGKVPYSKGGVSLENIWAQLAGLAFLADYITWLIPGTTCAIPLVLLLKG